MLPSESNDDADPRKVTDALPSIPCLSPHDTMRGRYLSCWLIGKRREDGNTGGYCQCSQLVTSELRFAEQLVSDPLPCHHFQHSLSIVTTSEV